MKKRKVLFLMSLFLIFITITFTQSADEPAVDGFDENGGTSEGEKSYIEVPIDEYSGYKVEDPDVKDDTDVLSIPPAEPDAEPSYTHLEGEFTGTIETGDWKAEGTFSNMVVGNGGLYEATITGLAAGTTVYFLSSFDDQIFKLEAGSDESEVRVIQFQKNGFSQDRIYMDLAEGDMISQGALLNPLIYHYEAYDDSSIYIYNSDQTTEITQGEHSYNGSYYEAFENPTDEEIATQLTQEGFEEITLPENASYSYKALGILDDINLTLSNSARQSISICKVDIEGCQAYNKITSFTIEGKDLSLQQNGYTIVESYDTNNILELNFAEQTAYLTNIDPKEEILAKIRVGYHEIEETQEDVTTRILEQEYPYLFTRYDSDKPFPELQIKNKVLIYTDQDTSAYSLPNSEEIEMACFDYAYKRITEGGIHYKTKPEYCA